ncbi:MAG: hypothetical protein QOC75_5291 [Pseudonocardiales bacterium]|nr:hypothetical protein [Pseudonocardiales bacterium]
MLLQDRDGGDRALEEPLEAQETPDEILLLKSFLEDVVTIEAHTGTLLPVRPNDITIKEMRKVAFVARTIRDRGHSAQLSDFKAHFVPGRVPTVSEAVENSGRRTPCLGGPANREVRRGEIRPLGPGAPHFGQRSANTTRP